jgi:hypothetical protein
VGFSPHLCVNGSSKVIKEVRSVFSKKVGIMADFFNSTFQVRPCVILVAIRTVTSKRSSFSVSEESSTSVRCVGVFVHAGYGTVPEFNIILTFRA